MCEFIDDTPNGWDRKCRNMAYEIKSMRKAKPMTENVMKDDGFSYFSITLCFAAYSRAPVQTKSFLVPILPAYFPLRNTTTGKGYADLVMIPRRNVSKPALVIELTNEREESGACSSYPKREGSRRSQLKFNQSTDTAIDQIKRKEYPSRISEYTGDILLVGINYDKETKQHTCKILNIQK